MTTEQFPERGGNRKLAEERPGRKRRERGDSAPETVWREYRERHSPAPPLSKTNQHTHETEGLQ